MKKAALSVLTVAMTANAANAGNIDTVAHDNDTVSAHQTIDSNVRVVSGVLIQERYTDVRIMNSDKQYKAYYLDTDNDFLEDYICLQIISSDELQCDYAPGTRMTVTEVRGNDGKWLVSKIQAQKTRRILSTDKSRTR